MKYNDNIIDKSTIILIITALIIGALILVLLFWNNKLDSKNEEGSQSSEVKNSKKVNIEGLMEDIKNKYSDIVYESNDNTRYKSIVYKSTEKRTDENNITKSGERYNSIIIDTYTGKEITFFDMLKENKLKSFEEKEKELLNLKYPEFIIKGIENGDGEKGYYVTENEVIIYYYDYIYNYDIKEEVTLKIDFNEIKDLLNYKDRKSVV